MKNPWLSRNPFLSMWLQAANTAWGAARGHALNEARRQQRAMTSESTRAMTALWSGSLEPRTKKKRRGR